MREAPQLHVRNRMPSPLRTFNPPAAAIAVTVALAAWLICALDLDSGYRYSRWLTIVRAPLLASAMYVYLTVAFNVAAGRFGWTRSAFVALWVALASPLPVVLSFGLVWSFMLLSKVVPGLEYLPFNLDLTENILYLFMIGVPAAFLYSAFVLFRSARLRSHE